MCSILMVMVKWSQFHNWVIVASLLNFGKGSNFRVKSLIWTLVIKFFFACLFQGKSHCIGELKAPNQVVGPKPLPRNLLFQMHNGLKANNNCYLLAFLSLLIIREVFKEVTFGFRIVGHTHEYINGGALGIVKKIERTKQLYFGRFDEGFHGLTKWLTFHSIVDPIKSRF